jgi:sugar phosphate isomerase/epimerase
MIPGVSSQIFHREKLGAAHAAAISQAGFTLTEAYTYPGHFELGDEAHARTVRAAFDDHGVTLVSLHAPFFDEHKSGSASRGRLSISSAKPAARAAALDAVRRCADTAAILGARILVIHFGDGGDKNTHAVIENLFSSMLHIEDILLGTGITAAYENIGTPTSLCGYIANMLDRYELRQAGVCLDIGHANINEDPATAVERAGARLTHIHASDNSGHEDQHNPPFLGSVRWDRVMPAILKSGYRGAFIFEPRFQPEPIKLLHHLRASFEKLSLLAQGENPDETESDTPFSSC